MPWLLLAIALIAAAALTAVWLARRPPAPARALAAFARQRPELEAAFLAAAAAAGKPRGLVWAGCAFAGEPLLARDRRSGGLIALVEVTVRFEAVPGTDMEGWDAVSRPRDASAVFAWRRGHWVTDGRTVFNLDPTQALHLFRQHYEPVMLGLHGTGER